MKRFILSITGKVLLVWVLMCATFWLCIYVVFPLLNLASNAANSLALLISTVAILFIIYFLQLIIKSKTK